MLVENEQGNYLFLPSSGRYSAGVVASPGHELVRAVLQRPRPLAEGFALIQGEGCGSSARPPCGSTLKSRSSKKWQSKPEKQVRQPMRSTTDAIVFFNASAL